MPGECLEGVWKVYRCCLEGVKRVSPARRLGLMKKGEDMKRVEEAPMRKMIESWIGGKNEKKAEKFVGVKGLLAKFSKEEEKEPSFEEWKKSRQELRQNTSLAAPGALTHRLQCRTASNT